MTKEGTVTATVTPGHFVLVRKFKFDTIRQQSYWTSVGKLCRQCKTHEAAEDYAARVEREQNNS